jgi:dihydroflavonol-4-reductase
MTARQNVLVTGASGFIAKHIVSQLLNAGYRVRGSVRSARRGQEVVNAMRPTLKDPNNLDQRLELVELDLSRDEGWNQAMSDMNVLMHTASPFPIEQPSNEEEIIRPAVDGTLRALRAAHRAGVNRVVITSSSVTIMVKELEPGRQVLDETDWTDLSDARAIPYVKSKTLAESAAWEFVKTHAPEMELTTINPAFVLGPPLDAKIGTSLKVVQRLLRCKDPMLPNFGFPTVDVRDIAVMHIRALERPETIGKRIIGGDQFLWFVDMAKMLQKAYPDRKMVTRKAPNFVVRFLSLFDREIRTIVHTLGREDRISSDRARTMLDMQFIDTRDSLKASAEFLVRNELV